MGGPEPEPIRLCIMVVGGTVGWGGPTPIRLVIKCLCKLIRFDIEAYADQLSNAYLMQRTNKKNHTVEIMRTISNYKLNLHLISMCLRCG